MSTASRKTPAVQPDAAPAVKGVAKAKPLAKKAAAPAPAKKVAAAKKAAAKKPAVKVAAPKKAAPVKTEAKSADKPAGKKEVKVKIVRDSFTMPEADFAIIEGIKNRALAWRQPVKKSEVLRAALHALESTPDAVLKQLLGGLVPIKKGRPKA